MRCFYITCPKHNYSINGEYTCTNKIKNCTATRSETIRYKLDVIRNNVPPNSTNNENNKSRMYYNY